MVHIMVNIFMRLVVNMMEIVNKYIGCRRGGAARFEAQDLCSS